MAAYLKKLYCERSSLDTGLAPGIASPTTDSVSRVVCVPPSLVLTDSCLAVVISYNNGMLISLIAGIFQLLIIGHSLDRSTLTMDDVHKEYCGVLILISTPDHDDRMGGWTKRAINLYIYLCF